MPWLFLVHYWTPDERQGCLHHLFVVVFSFSRHDVGHVLVHKKAPNSCVMGTTYVFCLKLIKSCVCGLSGDLSLVVHSGCKLDGVTN